MSISVEDIIKIRVEREELMMVCKMAQKAAIGGSSSVRGNRDDRMAHLTEDQIIGQLGQMVGMKYLYGNSHPYLMSRWHQNRMPTTGDSGNDVPGANIDFKASKVRISGNVSDADLMRYRMIVRPKERHSGWVYYQMLVSDISSEGATVNIMGWAKESMLPAKVEADGPFSGAFVLPVTKLHPLPPVNWEWFD